MCAVPLLLQHRMTSLVGAARPARLLLLPVPLGPVLLLLLPGPLDVSPARKRGRLEGRPAGWWNR